MLQAVKKYWLLTLALVLTVIKVVASVQHYHRLNNEVFDLSTFDMHSGIMKINPIVFWFFVLLLLLFAFQRFTKIEVVSLSGNVGLNLKLLGFINMLLIAVDLIQIFGYIASESFM